ncbi:MAG TPA: type II secretion system F family protein [Kiritimatiellia bacterium]|nr:type II secretion system F family protein [Kiritimatiellia bacterium]HPA78197.1 type II secretion system F family protein [Kiritimatiellia bacterium]HQQ04459.1 type II secretion system F family protein [Kiritimatiellia bacterium]
MPIYTYTARLASGDKKEGTLEANDRQSALIQIERMGAVPVSIREGTAAAAAPSGRGAKKRFALTLPQRAPRMNLRDVLLLTGEMSDLLASGMTLGHALNTLSRRDTDPGQTAIVTALRDEIIQGSSLSDALRKWPKTFSPLYVSMVRAGEASGMLSEALSRLRTHYERVLEAREKVSMALIYPAIILLLGGATLVFAVVFVVPRFTAIFAELGSTLPLPTRILIRLSELMIDYGLVVLIAAVAAGILLRNALRTEKGRLVWHRMQLHLPVVRHIITANAFGHFARTLGALLNNGVPVLQALGIVEETVGNVVIANEIHEARERVTDGSSISGPLAAGKIFPPLLTDMLAVGEESGDMPGALAHIARRYDSDLDRSVKILTTLLEPVLMVGMAVLVGFVAISMLLAVFDLTSGLNV